MKLLTGLLLLPVVGVSGAWIVVTVLFFQAQEQMRALAESTRPLIQKAGPEARLGRPVIRGPVLVWDLVAGKRLRFREEKLPVDLLARSAEDCRTLVCISEIQHDSETDYGNGMKGYRQVATVWVVLLPEYQIQGPYVIEGDKPPWIKFLKKGEKGPILGDLERPLGKWIQEQAR